MFPETKRFGRYISLLLIAVLLLSGSFVFTASAQSSDPPMHIHLTWQHGTNTTITVTWQTSTNTSGDTVLYDTASHGGNPSAYSYSATGINYTYSGASGYIHDVELTGLTPNTVYYFICGGLAGGYSSEGSFRTAPSVSSDIRFVAGGDSRTNIGPREAISKAMAEFNPAFVMHSGDMVEDGAIQSQWDSWFTDVNSHWVGENNLTIPIIPAIGNHEQNAVNYYKQFALPGNEMWYSYDWGPDIHIITLSSETAASGAQRDWLENDLASHANYTWKFVQFHKPPFVSGSHGPYTDARTHWVPLFDKYHVDIVFNGHEHSYQRSCPLNWTASQAEPQDYSNGTVYIVSGGWGAPLYTPSPIWYMAYQKKTYHFCLVDIFKNGTLHLQAKDNLGNTFDEISIHKLPLHDIAVTSVTPSPTEVTIGESVNITVGVKNNGTETETFNVTAYYDTTKIDTQIVSNLAAGATENLTFTWNTTDVSAGNYTIKAVAETVTGEKNAANNEKTDGQVELKEAPKPPIPWMWIIVGVVVVVVIIAAYMLTRKKLA